MEDDMEHIDYSIMLIKRKNANNLEKESVFLNRDEKKIIEFFSSLRSLLKIVLSSKIKVYPKENSTKKEEELKNKNYLTISKNKYMCILLLNEMRYQLGEWIWSADFDRRTYRLVRKIIEIISSLGNMVSFHYKVYKQKGNKVVLELRNPALDKENIAIIQEKINNLHDFINEEEMRKYIQYTRTNSLLKATKLRQYLNTLSSSHNDLFMLHFNFNINDYSSFIKSPETTEAIVNIEWWETINIFLTDPATRIEEQSKIDLNIVPIVQKFVELQSNLIKILHQRKKGIVNNIIGYVWRLEYGIYKKFNLHIMLLTDNPSEIAHIELEQFLQSKWTELTQNVGLTSRKKGVDFSKLDYYQKENIIDYLVNIDCFYRMNFWPKTSRRGEQVKLFGKSLD